MLDRVDPPSCDRRRSDPTVTLALCVEGLLPHCRSACWHDSQTRCRCRARITAEPRECRAVEIAHPPLSLRRQTSDSFLDLSRWQAAGDIASDPDLLMQGR